MIRSNLLRLLKNTDLRIVFVAIAIILSAQLGFILSFTDTSAQAIWPPVGVAFALVLLLGYKVWPGVFIGGFITYSISFISQNILISVTSITGIALITLGLVGEILIGYLLYKKIIKNNAPFDNTASTFQFLLISLIVCLIGAATYTGSLFMIGVVDGPHFIEVFTSNYLASVTGLLLFTNLILSWVKGKTHWTYSHRNLIEITTFTGSIFIIIYFLYNKEMTVAFERSFPFIIIPFLLWAAFSASIQVATTLVVMISLFSVQITQSGLGPFVLEDVQDSLFLLQIFIMVIGISTTVLSSSVFERTEARKKIEAFNETLEDAVVKRTKELDEEIRIRKESETEIRKTNQELRKINTELDNFVYKVSHDLRAPISSILGLVNIAKYDDSENNMKDCLGQIEKSARTQDNFIKDIIELSKNSRVSVKAAEINFKSLIDDTYEQIEHAYRGAPIKPKIKIKQTNPFYSDTLRLKVIFNNLITNSIKYGKEKGGKINIDVNVHNGQADIVIEDNGIGIPKEYQSQVFDMFYRATDQNAGSGLGLYIVKETIEKLEGSVTLESEANKGTKIQFTLPNKSPEKQKS